MGKLILPILLLLLAMPMLARGRSSRPHSSMRVSRTHLSKSHAKHNATSLRGRPSPATRCLGCERDKHGRIKRGAHAKREFQNSHPCPATGRTSGKCPGYVIDHVRALKRGGSDDPSNMQWQTKAQAKAKDRVE